MSVSGFSSFVSQPHRECKTYKNFLQYATNYSFDPGKKKACIARKRTNPVTQFFPQAILYKMTRKDDDLYWMRALWQVVFGQIFTSEEAFTKFLQSVAETAPFVPSQLHYQLGHVLLELKKYKLHGKEFLEYLNHEEVDNTLCSYLPEVAIGHMHAKHKHTGKYSLTRDDYEKNHDIDQEPRRILDSDIDVFETAFMEYFDLGKYRVVIEESGKEPLHSKEGREDELVFPQNSPVLLIRKGSTSDSTRNHYLVMQIAPDLQDDADAAQALLNSFVFEDHLRKSLETSSKTPPITSKKNQTTKPKPLAKTPKKIKPKKPPLPALCRFFIFLFEKCKSWLHKIFRRPLPAKK